MVCGSFASPQFAHSTEPVALRAWCERRMLRTDFDVFLLGTAMENTHKNKSAPEVLASRPRGQPLLRKTPENARKKGFSAEAARNPVMQNAKFPSLFLFFRNDFNVLAKKFIGRVVTHHFVACNDNWVYSYM
jgi:hypothetical protein